MSGSFRSGATDHDRRKTGGQKIQMSVLHDERNFREAVKKKVFVSVEGTRKFEIKTHESKIKPKFRHKFRSNREILEYQAQGVGGSRDLL